ncbi:hypothetical protein LCGC14_1365940 [marine sediment metagenome]|uniref:Metallo-beta-lactamase domain-containing protein n=1 Tax=marine sediment metagenome TaxID=412755 RepID=A0A0F9K7A9_9ZZZZ
MVPLFDDYKNIFLIKGAADGKSPYSNSLLIKDFLIDTGISSKHIRILKKNHININNIILSHWHQDHINGNRFFMDKPFFAHYEEKFILENFNKNYVSYYGITDLDTKRWFGDGLKAFRLCDIKVDTCLSDGDKIKIGEDLELEVIYTPGHSKGHCCFLELNSKILFLADMILYNPFYGGNDSNLLEFENSIKKLRKVNFNLAISSHMGIIENKNKLNQQLDICKNIINKRDEKILDFLSERYPVTICDLTKKNILYKTYISKMFEGYNILIEKNMIKKHLDKFLNKGIIRFEEEGYILQ